MDQSHLIRIYDSVVAGDVETDKLITDTRAQLVLDKKTTLRKRDTMRLLILVLGTIIVVSCAIGAFTAEGDVLMIVKHVSLATAAGFASMAALFFLDGFFFAASLSRDVAAVSVLDGIYPAVDPDVAATCAVAAEAAAVAKSTTPPTVPAECAPKPAVSDRVKLASLDTLTVDSFRAVQECVSALRAFSASA